VSILWGIVDFLKISVANLIIKMTFPFVSSIGKALWLNGIYGVVKIAAGAAIIISGKRCCKRLEGIA